MTFTILPDMEEKRRKREERNAKKLQKKEDREFKKKRKYIGKRESFGSIFGKTFVVVLLIFSTIAASATYAIERYAFTKVQNVYNEWKLGIIDSFEKAEHELLGVDYTDEEKADYLRRRLRNAMLCNNYSELYDFAATVYDMNIIYDPPEINNIVYGEGNYISDENVDTFCDSREGFCFINYRDNLRDVYECPKEAFGDLFDDLVKWASQEICLKENVYHWFMEDYYVKDHEILPGKVHVAKNNEFTGAIDRSTEKIYDFTPSDTTGYEHIITDEEAAKIYNGEKGWSIGYVYGGTKADSPAYKETKDCTVTYYEDGAVGVSWNDIDEYSRYSLDTDGTLSMTSSGYEFFGKRYVVITSGYYFFYKRHFKDLLRIYILVFLGVLAISLAISKARFGKLKIQYEVEDYRKSITDAMAHDLKSPLMAVSGMVENLKQNVHTEKREYYADVIAENVSYMNEIIEHMLELSKAETGNIKISKEELKLEAIVDSIIDKYSDLLDKKRLNIDMEVSSFVVGDKQLMTQAIDNLINNAIKFSEPEKTITIKDIEGGLSISNCYEPNENAIAVSELTKPFVKEDASRSNKSGSGIGLTIAKNLLAKQGYRLEIIREEGVFTAIVKK